MVPAKVLRTLAGSSAAGALSFVSVFTPLSVPAQEAERNHLDCWFDEMAGDMKCPPMSALQTGRASRVDQAFDVVDTPVAAVDPDVQGKSAPPARKQRPVSLASSDPKTPGCTRYKTYNPATRTYRSYEGVIRKCR
jgi:hypothetical protein